MVMKTHRKMPLPLLSLRDGKGDDRYLSLPLRKRGWMIVYYPGDADGNANAYSIPKNMSSRFQKADG